jgi:hypothetical protein
VEPDAPQNNQFFTITYGIATRIGDPEVYTVKAIPLACLPALNNRLAPNPLNS